MREFDTDQALRQLLDEMGIEHPSSAGPPTGRIAERTVVLGESGFAARVRREVAQEDARVEIANAQQGARTAREAAALEERKRIAEAEEAQIKELIDRQREAASRHVGTPPEEVLGDTAGKLCRDFIDFMKQKNFAGARTFLYKQTDQLPSENDRTKGLFFWREADEPTPRTVETVTWSIRGYGVGGIDLGLEAPVTPSEMVIRPDDAPIFPAYPLAKQAPPATRGIIRGTRLPYNVFLCEDYKLRLHADRHFVDTLRRRILDPDAGTLSIAGYEGSQVLCDLPLNRAGRHVIPRIGRYGGTREESPERRETDAIFHPGGDYTDGTYEPIEKVTTALHVEVFQEQPLQTVLMQYAKEAERQLSASSSASQSTVTL